MKKLFTTVYTAMLFLIVPPRAFAIGSDITNYTNDTLQIITLLASGAATFFLFKGGYHYTTSTGHPEGLENVKKTIRNALIGLSLVIGSNVVVSLLLGLA